jgi:hypothetical protein
MRRFATCLLLATMTPAAIFAQQSTKRQSGDRISRYMREAGLVYVEVLDDALEEAAGSYRRYLEADDVWGLLRQEDGPHWRTLEDLEERMLINLQLPGDRTFREYLIHIKSVADIVRTRHQRTAAYEQVATSDAMGRLLADCQVQAYIAIGGGVFDRANCTDAAFAAAHTTDSTADVEARLKPTRTASFGPAQGSR